MARPVVTMPYRMEDSKRGHEMSIINGSPLALFRRNALSEGRRTRRMSASLEDRNGLSHEASRCQPRARQNRDLALPAD
jgi:hypothetical protein